MMNGGQSIRGGGTGTHGRRTPWLSRHGFQRCDAGGRSRAFPGRCPTVQSSPDIGRWTVCNALQTTERKCSGFFEFTEHGDFHIRRASAGRRGTPSRLGSAGYIFSSASADMASVVESCGNVMTAGEHEPNYTHRTAMLTRLWADAAERVMRRRIGGAKSLGTGSGCVVWAVGRHSRSRVRPRQFLNEPREYIRQRLEPEIVHFIPRMVATSVLPAKADRRGGRAFGAALLVSDNDDRSFPKCRKKRNEVFRACGEKTP